MIENRSENGPRPKEPLPLIDFFRRWGQYRGQDCALLASQHGLAIAVLFRTYRLSGFGGLSSHVPEIVSLAVLPIGLSIVTAIGMRREAIKRDHLSNLK